MKLPGKLAMTTLGDLLGALHRERATGVLSLTESQGPTAGAEHRVALRAGLVQSVQSNVEVQRLGELLTQEGFVDRESLRRVGAKLVQRPSARFGELLVEEIGLDPAIVDAALRRQLRARLDALFRIEQATVRFHLLGARAADSNVPLSPREFLHGRPRARRTSEPKHAAARRTDPVRARALSVLGVPPGADREAVSRAFRQLARTYHPDTHPAASSVERAELLRRFAELSAAYHALVG